MQVVKKSVESSVSYFQLSFQGFPIFVFAHRPDLHMATCVFQIGISNDWTEQEVGSCKKSVWILFPTTIFTICRHLIFNFLRIRPDLHMATCVFQIDISHDWTEQEVGSCKKSVWILFPTIFTVCRHSIFNYLRIRPDLHSHMATCVFQIDISNAWTEQEVGSCENTQKPLLRPSQSPLQINSFVPQCLPCLFSWKIDALLPLFL